MNSVPYELDPFQVEACRAIDAHRSVIVSAPTGAGKTLIAEYATDRCRDLGRRVIYTAPIKALSNQKYRDFRARYGEDVGIVTGDVVLNPTAPVLVMTTEILRNSIFEDPAQLEDVDYVVFDEIHYINDIERGTVWEESIIFAPQTIRFVCLSATIPNLTQFAEWLRSVRDIDTDIVSETVRPVPLEHAVYIPGYGVGTLDDLKRVQDMLADEPDTDVERQFRHDRHTDLGLGGSQLVTHLVDHFRLPCLYFCFSRRGCEERARDVASARSFLTPTEEAEILDTYDRLCQTFDLAHEARALEFRDLVRCGVAYHHAGMFPTLKEVVERLFTLGRIQFLCTTETFAVGVNMPARSVVFDSLVKFDGVSRRYMRAREYWQMAGRAGRRGIDDHGYIYATVDPVQDQASSVEHVLTGEPEAIESQFNLAYSSILNLLEEHGDRIFEVCRKSFGNFQRSGRIMHLRQRLRELQEVRARLQDLECIYGHDAMTLLTEHQNRSLDVDRKIQELRPRRSRIKRRYRGRKRKGQRMQRLEQVNRAEARIKEELTRHDCHTCDNVRECQTRFSRIHGTDDRISGLGREVETVEQRQRQQIESRLKVLERLGCLAGWDLLPRGDFASNIYGYELQATQLLFGGHFERADPDHINAIAVALVFESKRDEWYRRIEDDALRRVLRAADDEVEKVRALEVELEVDDLTKSLDPRLAAASIAWSRGCAFDELAQHTSTPEGDLVRVFRGAIDLLRQLRRALVDHPTLPDLLTTAMDRLNRDVVDAERQLRADAGKTAEPEAIPAD